ncbi:MchS3 family protein [Herbaspirillum sp. YR522]|uniref:MchS3 family protein n=1 Tax=Herbaspirillum sp. YR522 TaxID=1144342 RepID=UPI00026FBC7E|nr:MchS3 family protein [Herbaspirillum sp. YR522]EJN00304.1 hypothetical protein PMI40_03638 [Herbaspirillum sp. YR522]
MHILPIPSRKTARSILGAFLLFSQLNCLANNLDTPADELAQVNTFALGYVGFVSHISAEEYLYRSVQGSANATAAFTAIVRSPSATPEGKAYAACGLWHASRFLFTQEMLHLRQRNAEVSVLRADILRKEKLTDLIDRIEKHGCSNF